MELPPVAQLEAQLHHVAFCDVGDIVPILKAIFTQTLIVLT